MAPFLFLEWSLRGHMSIQQLFLPGEFLFILIYISVGCLFAAAAGCPYLFCIYGYKLSILPSFLPTCDVRCDGGSLHFFFFGLQFGNEGRESSVAYPIPLLFMYTISTYSHEHTPQKITSGSTTSSFALVTLFEYIPDCHPGNPARPYALTHIHVLWQSRTVVAALKSHFMRWQSKEEWMRVRYFPTPGHKQTIRPLDPYRLWPFSFFSPIEAHGFPPFSFLQVHSPWLSTLSPSPFSLAIIIFVSLFKPTCLSFFLKEGRRIVTKSCVHCTYTHSSTNGDPWVHATPISLCSISFLSYAWIQTNERGSKQSISTKRQEMTYCLNYHSAFQRTTACLRSAPILLTFIILNSHHPPPSLFSSVWFFLAHFIHFCVDVSPVFHLSQLTLKGQTLPFHFARFKHTSTSMFIASLPSQSCPDLHLLFSLLLSTW